MPKRHPVVLDSATGEAADTEPKREKIAPDLVDLEEAKRRLRESKTAEGRLKLAKPFPLPEFDVMVAPAIGLDIYEKLFGDREAMFKGEVDLEKAKDNVDLSFVKMFMQNCIVSPVVDGEFLDDLLDAHPAEFQLLMSFCQQMTQQDPTKRVSDRLGLLDTGAQEVFFDALAGSMNMPTPA